MHNQMINDEIKRKKLENNFFKNLEFEKVENTEVKTFKDFTFEIINKIKGV